MVLLLGFRVRYQIWQFLKSNLVLLAQVLMVLFQQSEIREMERTLNYIYAAVQKNNDDIQLVQDEVWAIGDILISVHFDGESGD